jgi:hypothetical protein
LQTEIHNKLKSERLKEMTDKYTNSFQAIPNEAYFGQMPAGPPGRPGMNQGAPPPHMRPQMAPPASPQSAPPSTQAPSQPPPPPSKPD